MSVKLRTMTTEEFETFYRWTVKNHARELTEELQFPHEKAIQETIAEVAAMLPEGLLTEYNDLMTIEAENENVGFIWTLYEETEGRKQCFICDFAIWESKRRKGHGEAALCLAEKNAVAAGCQESLLFVRDDNTAANALYIKCGYQVLRQSGYGKFMAKPLA